MDDNDKMGINIDSGFTSILKHRLDGPSRVTQDGWERYHISRLFYIRGVEETVVEETVSITVNGEILWEKARVMREARSL